MDTTNLAGEDRVVFTAGIPTLSQRMTNSQLRWVGSNERTKTTKKYFL